jgi:pimeloyl-ACP methyl ester carboxylesterase
MTRRGSPSTPPGVMRVAHALLRPRPTSFGTPPTLVRRFFHGHDGTRLAYYTTGRADAPPLVISAGLGGGVRAWSALIDRLQHWVRIYAWDYRGLYASSQPVDPTSFTIPHHAADLVALLDHLELEAPILAGWSMGVQVNLELHRNHAERLRALICLHGSAGRPLSTAFDGPWFGRISPSIFEGMRRHWRAIERPIWRLARSRRIAGGFMAAARELRLMDGAMDPDLFYDMARDWVNLDIHTYADIFEALGEHDAADLLSAVRVPTLIIAGAKDRFTPAKLSHALAAGIADSELFILPDATHFGLLEYPDATASRIERFLTTRLDLRRPPS